MTLEQRLTKLARDRGWRLAWSTSPEGRLILTTLHLFAGKRKITQDGGVWVLTGGAADPRERIARRVLIELRDQERGVSQAA